MANQYTIAEVKALLEQTKKGNKPVSLSTFYRLAREGVIRKHLPEGQVHDATYNKEDVDDLITHGTPTKRRNTPRLEELQTTSVIQESTSEAATDWIQFEDEPYAYVLDCELYGIENCVPPHITWTWWQKNPHACRILYNKNNRRDIWGLLSVLPMEEETIVKLLRDEMQEKDIKPEHVLDYKDGGRYSCYVAAVSIRPERRAYFGQLLHSVLAYWCEQYPSIQIAKLFAFALGGDEGDGMRMIRKLYFAPRYDIGENAWELRLDRYNPDPLIQDLQKCFQARVQGLDIPPVFRTNRLMLTKRERDTTPPAVFTKAKATDIAATLDIDERIFGPAPMAKEALIQIRLGWWEKNPDIFQVLKLNEQVIGYHAMVPLPRQKIENILREVEHPRDITPDEILPLEPGVPVDLYVIVTGVDPALPTAWKHIYAPRLLNSVVRQFREMAKRGIVINTIFGRSRTPEGIRLLEDLGFAELPYSPANGKRLYGLEVQTSEKPFAQMYRKLLEERYGPSELPVTLTTSRTDDSNSRRKRTDKKKSPPSLSSHREQS